MNNPATISPYDDQAKLTQHLARIEAATDVAVQAAADREHATRTEAIRRDIQRRAQRMVDDFVTSEAARAGIAELKTSRIMVMLKKPKEYYNAYVESVALMLADGYLLDRPVNALIAHVLPEASRRAKCAPTLSASCWYREFSPAVQKRVNALLASLRLRTAPNTLSEVSKAIRGFHSGQSETVGATGTTLNGKRFQFNGDGSMIWAGAEYSIVLKRSSRYVRIGADYINIDTTLKALGITAAEIAAWEAHAAILHAKRRDNEATHDEAEHFTGSRYD
jgi:hypothetical protein